MKELARERLGLPAHVTSSPAPLPSVVTLTIPLTGLVGPAKTLVRKEPVFVAADKPLSISGSFLKHAFVGAGVSFVDASKIALNPVSFLWNNADVIAKGFLYLILPILVTFGLFYVSPEVKSAYPPNSWQGSGFVILMYIASSFSILVSLFSIGFLWKSVTKLVKVWARKGQEALQ